MRRDPAYLTDILHAATLALRFVEGMTYDELVADEKTKAALIREFEIIGEAAGRMSTEFVVSHPELPWREMVSMRNRMIHGYHEVDLRIVWRAVQTDIPELIELIAPLVEPDS